jgi:hypothetical protein
MRFTFSISFFITFFSPINFYSVTLLKGTGMLVCHLVYTPRLPDVYHNRKVVTYFTKNLNIKFH